MTLRSGKDARQPGPPGATESFSRLIRLSLGRLLLSRACFRFAGRESLPLECRNAWRNSKPAKRASRVQAVSGHIPNGCHSDNQP
jgi:hypothetical protein